MKDGFISIGKINKGAGHLLAAARHNKRKIQAELGADSHIQAHLMALNLSLCGAETAEGVAELAKTLMRDAGIVKLRKDTVRAIEIVFSLPINRFKDCEAYFRHCLRWAAGHFGGMVLSADIHKDEANPHCHVLILPLIDGRMMGSDIVGYGRSFKAHLDAFFDDVGASWGLDRPQARMTGEAKDEAAISVLKYLKATDDPVLRSALWPSIKAQIESEPDPHMLALGLTNQAKAKPMRTMAQIFTSNGKGAKVDKANYSKPIGFDVLSGSDLAPIADTLANTGSQQRPTDRAKQIRH